MCIGPYCQKVVYMFIIIFLLWNYSSGAYVFVHGYVRYLCINISILHIHEQRLMHANTIALHQYSIRQIRWCTYQCNCNKKRFIYLLYWNNFYSNLSEIRQDWTFLKNVSFGRDVHHNFVVSTILAYFYSKETFSKLLGISEFRSNLNR